MQATADIDLSADMVRETQTDIRHAGWQQVTMQQMDAEQLDVPAATFDRVLCGFAVWFFPQPHRALHEFFRVLKPGGRVGLTTWAEDCPFLTWCRRELTASFGHHVWLEGPMGETPGSPTISMKRQSIAQQARAGPGSAQ